MNLETEFRIRQQLASLEQELAHTQTEWSRSHCLTFESEFAPSTWVQLRQRPDPLSSDEALLLCQYSAEGWIAWVPGYGEILLSQRDFQAQSPSDFG